MLQRLKDLFRERVRPETADASLVVREHALRIAAAALLIEVGRSDGRVADEERTVIRTGIQGTLGLSAPETDELLRLAEEESRKAVRRSETPTLASLLDEDGVSLLRSLYEFTQVLDSEFSPEQKKRVVELLWLVAFADAEKDPHEEHLVRKIAGLLHVPHPDFIDAKIRARGRSEATGHD